MRFGRSFQDVTWLQRGFQARLFRWVGVLVVILVVSQIMWSATRKSADPAATLKSTAEDRRVVLESNEQLPPEVVKILPDATTAAPVTPRGSITEEGLPDVSLGSPTDTVRSGGTVRSGDAAPTGGATAPNMPAGVGNQQAPPASVDVFAETAIDPIILRDVVDNTLGVRISEADAFYRLLSHARLLPAEYLTKAARHDLTWDNLMADPKVHRGELVEIRGDLRRLSKIQASQNSYGVVEYYEAWIFTADSSSFPWRVVTAQIDPDLKLGDQQMTPVRVAGYFFKREGYDAAGGLRVTPLLIGKRLDLVRATSVPPTDMTSFFYLAAVIGLVLLAVLAMLGSISYSDMKYQREVLMTRNESSREALESIPPVNLPSVFEQLEQISSQEIKEDLPDLDEMTSSRRNGAAP